ncbi:DUF1801 domain-containing protein [Flavobacterium sp. W21_SRS_FM6]|uniref:DUF1801 domain-containing protein n=1 Tax=Flavobacterium sp. W21_SRS_FM6 TaxID=3240268 RepID=UPI003F8DF388
MMNEQVLSTLSCYPDSVQTTLLQLRTIIFDVAATHQLGEVHESIKWGEPSYSVKGGTPVRMGWKVTNPQQCFLFFNCNTSLVETFRERYAELLILQGNRAIVLNLDSPIPVLTLRQCVKMAFTYKTIKHLPPLGN